jgi:hypothetical protein
VKNPGRTDKTVPNFEDDVMMYAKTPEEIHEWIHNGVSHKKAASITWRAERDRGMLKMPAFRGRLGERDMDELVRDSTEFRQWVEHGVSRRFETNPFAAFFLRRAVLKMPAYEKHVETNDVAGPWAYVTWLRLEGSRANATPMEEHHHE